MKSFCENYGLTNLVKEPICYKSPTNLTCVDLSYKCTSLKSPRSWISTPGLPMIRSHAITVSLWRRLPLKLITGFSQLGKVCHTWPPSLNHALADGLTGSFRIN